jgi:hypothetical protein
MFVEIEVVCKATVCKFVRHFMSAFRCMYMRYIFVFVAATTCMKELECHFERSACGFHGSVDWAMVTDSFGRHPVRLFQPSQLFTLD